MVSMEVVGDTSHMAAALNLRLRLEMQEVVKPEVYEEVPHAFYTCFGYSPGKIIPDTDYGFPGASVCAKELHPIWER